MSLQKIIEDKLTAEFTPLSLEVENESHLHAGHKGSPGTGESHFSVKIVSEKFAGLSRVKAHQMVYQTLKSEISGKIHALKISAKSPSPKENNND